MALKSDKEKKGSKASAPETPKQTSGKGSSKAKKEATDDDDDDEDFDTPKAAPKKNAKSSAKAKKDDDDDDDIDDVEETDDWEKVEEEEEWDPDFDEFDVPKSKAKKSAGGPAPKKTGKGADDDDLGLDEDFKDLDLFGEGGFEEEDDDF
jgi:hypothetical protein